MKKIIVTGYNGFIGSTLVNLLADKGYEVTGIDTNFYDSDCEFFKPQYENIKQVNKDIRNLSEKDIEGAYAICHLAALSNDPAGELNKALTMEINYGASVNLAEMAKRTGVEKFIYSSSCSIYGVSGTDKALGEEAEFSPVTAYAESKVLSEKNIMPLRDKNFSVTFLRNATAYGISPKLRIDLVVNNLMGWAMATGQIKIMSDGTPWRPLIHAEDIGRAFLSVIEAPKDAVNGEPFNVGENSENYRVKDIAALIHEIMPKCNVVITGEHGSDSRTYKVDFSKIKRHLPNFKPKWNLKKGIEQIHDFYQRCGMDSHKLNERYFVRLKQLKYLIENNKVDNNLRWR